MILNGGQWYRLRRFDLYSIDVLRRWIGGQSYRRRFGSVFKILLESYQKVRGFIYDLLISKLTTPWYRAVLEQVPGNSSFLDVGIGTGRALSRNADLIKEKNFRVRGIDIDDVYLSRCRRNLKRADLDSRVEVVMESILNHAGGPYDVIFFGGSFMVMSDPVGALRAARRLLRAEGVVCFTQTFEARRTKWLERIKPWLKVVSTIDFGRVSYEEQFYTLLSSAGFEVTKTVDLGGQGPRSYKMVMAAIEGPQESR